ncbi:MAG: hypothetical protein JW728_07620 [Candidatus Aureabacteria bacterium]|nr:hypothetical protein [Candidatus Auribacterota bacterium]
MKIKLLAVISIVLLSAVAAPAYSETYEKFAPCFVDVNGWSADEVTGIDLFMPNMSLVNAIRTYSSGDKEASVMIMAGSKALAAQQQEANIAMETSDFNAVSKKIDGFQVTGVYDKANKTGSVVVIISQTEQKGVFITVTYTNITEAEAIGFSRAFDWNRVKDIAKTINF